MELSSRIEHTLNAAVAQKTDTDSPPGLDAAVRHALFPGGGRIRPRLCLNVALACGDPHPHLSNAAAAAVEMLHCASLVHDDMPCFDDADTRRGRPSVHRAYGEPLALLAGDALIVTAFDVLARAGSCTPQHLAPLVATVARGTGMPHGIVAGQAWECENDPDLAAYHRAKTAALFGAATSAGAISAGVDGHCWHLLGERLGEAYQVADDICDATGNAEEVGKPVGRDEALQRPSAVRAMGVDAAGRHFKQLVCEALDVIPACDARDALRGMISGEIGRLINGKRARCAA